MQKQTAGIVLAAGFGTRLKNVGDKPLLTYQGKTFVELVVDNLKQLHINPILVVTNKNFYPQISKLRLDAKIIINANPDQGMLSSIWLGMDALPEHCAGFFLCPIDYPTVKLNTFKKLLHEFSLDKTYCIKPQYKNKSGHPLIVPDRFFDELRKAPLKAGAKFVTHKYRHLTKFIPVDDPGILLNINTPELYYQYCQ